MRRHGRILGAALGVTALLAVVPATTARAQSSPGSEKITAEALFEDGRRLAAEGKYGDACPKFQASQKLDPSAGTLLNLASCWEKQGRTASAWGTYREAASAADAAGRKDYVATAQRHADALVPKLARLTVNVDQPVDGLLIKRDGAPVDRAEWGVPIPVDAGSHTIEASAPGHKGWATAVAVGQDGAQATLSVPVLEAAPQEAPPAAPPPAAVAPAPVMVPVGPGSTSTDQGSSAQRPIGMVLAGIGVVGLGIGAGLSLEAKAKYNDSLNNCEATNPDLCGPTGLSQRDSARSAGNAATVAVGVGAAALVGGLVVWLTAPGSGGSGGSARVFVAPAPGGAVVEGSW